MKDKNKQLGLVSRPPIIVVLGHVDHGKTSLLDYIKKTKIAEKESGGITQHIGAYGIEVKDKKITFIDTPGHEAFSKIRSRGAKVADIAILVVAADEGVKVQTKESLKDIKEAQIPYIVAITKTDKEGANLEKVKNELSEAGVLLEGRGGDVPFIGVSSKTGQGIDEFLELILLLSEMQELKANPNNQASGVVIESHLDRARGNTASLIITDGTLHIRDEITVDQMIIGKVRILEDFQGKPISEATFSSPVRVLGFEKSVPVGAKFSVGYVEEKTTESIQKLKITSKELGDQDSKIKIPIIIKSDTSGSGEALEQVIAQIGEKNDWLFFLLKNETGDISEGDFKITPSGKTLIIGFRVKKRPEINTILLSNKNLLLIKGDIIYEIKDKIKELVKNEFIKKPTEEILGKLEVLAIFNPIKGSQLIGGKVMEGKVQNKIRFRLLREEEIISQGKILNLQKNKADVSNINTGEECGLIVNCPEQIEKGDLLVFFRKI
jgi:translation initiation factor IF-2